MTELQEKIIELKKQGLKTDEVVEKLSCYRRTVQRIWARYKSGDRFNRINQYDWTNEEYKQIFESRQPAYIFIANDGGAEGFNYIQCRYCGAMFRRTAQNMRPSKCGRSLTCQNCERLYREHAKKNKKKNKKKSEAYIKYLQTCMFPKGKRGEQLKMRECIICKQLFIPGSDHQKYCSATCASYLHWKGKEAYRYKIDLMVLYRRDKGICHLCGQPCDLNDYKILGDGSFKVGNNYPTRDHVIPKSKGGEHSYQNIKLAHHRCNTLRGTKEMIAPPV